MSDAETLSWDMVEPCWGIWLQVLVTDVLGFFLAVMF